MLGVGILILGIITPCLQTALAYLYFKKGHIWSRVLNAALAKAEQESDRGYLSNWINNVRDALRLRVW